MLRRCAEVSTRPLRRARSVKTAASSTSTCRSRCATRRRWSSNASGPPPRGPTSRSRRNITGTAWDLTTSPVGSRRSPSTRRNATGGSPDWPAAASGARATRAVVASDVEPLRAPEHRRARVGAVLWRMGAHRRHRRSQHVGCAYPGSGLYISLDRGLTWHGLFGAASPETGPQGQPRRVGCIATGMGRSLAFGSVYLDENMPAGLYFADLPPGAGVDFDDLNTMRWAVCSGGAWGERSYNCHSVVFHPDGKTIFTAIEPDGTLNGIWRSRDRGRSWEHLTKGLPRGEYFRRISLALARPIRTSCTRSPPADRPDVLGVFRPPTAADRGRKFSTADSPTSGRWTTTTPSLCIPDDPTASSGRDEAAPH